MAETQDNPDLIAKFHEDLAQQLSFEIGLDVEPYTQEQLREVIGSMADSRNDIIILRHKRNPVLVKQYKAGDFQERPNIRAQTEVKVLRKLEESGFSNSPRLVEDSGVIDIEGTPTVLVEYIQDLYPAIALKEQIAAEAVGESQGELNLNLFRMVAQFHKLGLLHGDLHLGNLNVKRTEAALTQDNFVLLDFESVSEIEYPIEYSGFIRTEDLRYLLADMILNGAKHRGEDFLDADFEPLKQQFQKGYLDSLNDTSIQVDQLFDEALTEAREMFEEGIQ